MRQGTSMGSRSRMRLGSRKPTEYATDSAGRHLEITHRKGKGYFQVSMSHQVSLVETGTGKKTVTYKRARDYVSLSFLKATDNPTFILACILLTGKDFRKGGHIISEAAAYRRKFSTY